LSIPSGEVADATCRPRSGAPWPPRDPQASSVGGFTIAATRSAPLTEKGSLLGTLQYMSPEQLEGVDVDARSDIFSFGAMLFEMLTGQRAFDSKSQAGVIAAILNADTPPLATLADFKATLPGAVQRTLDRLLQKCLAKNPDDRWQCAADLADELRWIDQERLREENPADLGAAAMAPQVAVSQSRLRERWWMGAAAAACLVAAALAAWEFLRPPPPPAQTISFAIEAPDKQPFASGPGLLAVSPDGRRLAFVAGTEKKRLWVRSLGSTTAQPLAGTDDAWQPSWSPDSRFIIFTAGTGAGKLKKIDVMGGPATTLADYNLGRAAWSPAGVIVFRARDGRLMRVGEGGGDATPATELDKTQHETGHDWPVFLSDGRRFLFQARTSDVSQTALYLGSIDSMARTRLMDLQSSVDYVNGYLLYSREGTLMAQPFDEKHGRLTGQPTLVVENLIYNAANGRAAFSESTNGILAYRTGSNIRSLVLTWYDRTGKVLGTIGDAAEYSTPRVSPDGRRLVLSRRDATGHTDLWIFDLDRGVPTRFTSDPADDAYPVWSPDGAQVFFASTRKGTNDLYVRQAGGAGPEELLYASPENKTPTGVSPDGGLLLFNRGMPGMGSDIWALPLKGDRKPFPVVATTFNEGYAVFSPDGRWIAYDSTDTGPLQVYVQPFPATGARIQLSTTSGMMPSWTADGRSVVYATADKRLMVVDVTPSGTELKPNLPRELPIPLTRTPNPRFFAMVASAERFLVPMAPVAGAEAPITVVVNWMNALKK